MQSLANAGSSKGDLTGNEGLASALALMVEEDAATAKHAVGFAILLDNPKAIEFGYSIWAVGVEWGILVLGHFLNLTVEFGGAGLIDAAGLLQMAGAHGLQHAEHAGGIDVSGELGRVEGDLHVALSGQIVNLVGPHLVHHLHDRHGVA